MAERFDIPRAPISASRISEAFKELDKAQSKSKKAQRELEKEVFIKKAEA